jgi:hypothetical protein
VKRVFILQKSWSKDDHNADDVHAAIRLELSQAKAQVGMSKMKTCQHSFSKHDIANMHSAADRDNKDRSKFLKGE